MYRGPSAIREDDVNRSLRYSNEIRKLLATLCARGLGRQGPRVFQMRERDGGILVSCDAVNVTLLMHAVATLIAYQINCQIYGLITLWTVQRFHTVPRPD